MLACAKRFGVVLPSPVPAQAGRNPFGSDRTSGSRNRLPGVGSKPQRPVVDVAHAAKRPGQDVFLFGRRVEAEAAAARHTLETSTLTCKVSATLNLGPRPGGRGFFPLR